jgi:2',3'-cyclic-nucleotide 2'-phosphodiesterase (5'-nucleotidase family)
VSALTIIHTADLHGDPHGIIERAGNLKQRLPGALWLDSGDALKAPNVSLGITWEDTLTRMTREGCSAMAMGNREFELLAPCHRLKLAQAGFPVIATNLSHPRPRSSPVAREVRFRMADGRRVRIWGALRDMVPSVPAKLLTSYRFSPPLDVLRRRCERAEWDDLLILLSHLGGEEDLSLLKRLPRLDLILGGHDHHSRLERNAGRAAVAPPPHGEALAVIVLKPGSAPDVRFCPPWKEDELVAKIAP